jgi:hypothetical protein
VTVATWLKPLLMGMGRSFVCGMVSLSVARKRVMSPVLS